MEKEKEKTKILQYKGREMETIHFTDELNDDIFQEVVREYYQKPEWRKVENEIKKIHNNDRVMITNITNYYFKDIMAKVTMSHSKWSIEEVLESKELVGHFVAKTKKNDKVYPPNKSLISNFETALRLGGKGTAGKPSNFPVKVARDMINKYNTNGNYYDFSCGWGVRLQEAMKSEINYYGTDPNYLLTERLEAFANDYKTINNTNSVVEILTQGSEICHKEWQGKMGLCFSSPPYFNLEDYGVGEQSINNRNYDQWLNSYWRATMENIVKYLTADGNCLININNIVGYNLVEDTMSIAEEVGLKYQGYENLDNIKRANSNGGLNDNSEKILIFKK